MAGIAYNRPERDARTRAQTDSGTGTGDGSGVQASPLECPSCLRSDEVRAVPAVCLSGHSRLEQGGTRGDDRSVHTREVVPRLAAALAATPPAPVTAGRAALSVLLILVSIGTFVGGATGGKWFADPPKSGPQGSLQLWGGAHGEAPPEPAAGLLFLGWISAFALLGAALLILSAVRIQRAFRARIAAGRDAAEEVWSRGWCCARCAVVHFAGGPAMSLREFRATVWGAGGYGDLAREHRVMGAGGDY
ncbi:hypothetical protein OG239_09470 [Streptomyces sp. NBC_00868]|uniref:hypothetical protein n=1 Tax=unclassified Streptomyces TaxID=2593676 RepID=UPI00324A8E62|nr:hypothetical protein OG239_09470 [Streptomyces sp. NBC_00868]